MTAERTELRTERLLLRPFRLDDIDDVLGYASDEEWSRYLYPGVPYPYTRRDAERYIADSILRDDRERGPRFAIERDGLAIGSMDLHLHRDETGSLGYGIARSHWGQGLTTEAAVAVVEYGFGALRLARIVADADARNVGSWRVMEKIGMTREGVFRLARVDRTGNRADDVHYAILHEEWEKTR